MRHSSRRRPRGRPQSWAARLFVRPLEDRVVPTTYVVSNTLNAGAGSLRDAITQANTNPGPDAIQFDPTFATSAHTISVLLAALPTITDPVTITGPGSGLLTVQQGTSGATYTGITVDAAISPAVSLSGLTVAGFPATGLVVGNASVTLTDVVIQGNGGSGIAVMAGGSLTATNCTITGNAGNGGGGIRINSGASLLLANSTVSGNGSNSNLSLGGGIYATGTPGAGGVTVRNCTITGNTAYFGSGIGLKYFAGTVLVQNCTIVRNALMTENTAAGTGGGIACQAAAGATTLVLQSTIVSGSALTYFSYAPAQPELSENPTGQFSIQADHCLIGNGTVTALVSTNNFIGTSTAPLDPLLRPLADNGGPTRTLAPYPGSLAVDHGSNPAGLTSDQTGTPRVQGNAPDIGAVEHVFGLPVAVGGPAQSSTAAPGGLNFPFIVNYYADGAIDTASLDGSDILVTGPNGFSQSAQFVGVAHPADGMPWTATYQVVISATSSGAYNGVYSMALQPNQVFDTAGSAVPAGPLGTFRAGVFLVTTLADSGTGSLRTAIGQANILTTSANVIAFDPALFAGGPGTISLSSALPTASDMISIVGPGPGLLTIMRATNAFTQFAVLSSGGTQQISIAGLTVTRGTQSGLHLVANTTLTNVTVTGNVGRGIYGGGIITLHNCSVVNNTAGGSSGGGGIYFGSGALDIEDSDISGNTAAPGANGGGIDFVGGGLTVRRSTIMNNVGGIGGGMYVARSGVISDSRIAGNSTSLSVFGFSGGGGIAVDQGATLTVQNSTVSGNTAGPGTALYYGFGNDMPALGGGIRVFAGASLVLVNSTVSGNMAVDGGAGMGGGVYFGSSSEVTNARSGGGVTVRDSTIVGNVAPNGGGIGLGTMRGGAAVVQNSTVTGNTATSVGATAGYGGGGLAQYSAGATTGIVTLQSTIVAGNTAANGRPDLAKRATGVTVTADHSLLGAADTVTLAAGSVNNLTGTAANPLDPKLAPLADNGGPSWTCAPTVGSPALNAGSTPAGLTTDQRGISRLVGTAPDIGAYEYVPITVAGVHVNDGSAQRSEVRSLTVTFSGPVSFAGGNAAAAFQLQHVQTGDTVTLAAAVSTNGAGQTVVTLTFLPTNVNGVNDTDPISGSNGGQLSLADGRYQLTINAAAVSDAALGWGFDGDGDGVPGGNYVTPTETAASPAGLHLYRLFGDATGDGVVDLSDLTAFRGAYNAGTGNPAYLAYVDADNSGAIDLTDLTEFRNRYNHSVFG
jgi:hypothetical protein